MDTRQMMAMAEATRLTRQGRLVEATALIQQALTGPAVGRRAPHAPSAGEENDSARDRHPNVPAPLPAHRGKLPTRVLPGWARSRAFFSPGAYAPGLAHRPAAPAASRSAGRFDALSYTNAAGTRGYRIYVPAGHVGGPLPLLVMLHGGTQDAVAFAAATAMNDLAEDQGFLVAYPEQARSANAGRYWNWFAADHQRRDAGEPSLIAGITRHVTDRYGADASRVYVAGFSAGGAMAAVMAAAYPDLYAAVGVHSGLPYAAAGDLASAFTAMRQGPSYPARPPAHPLPLIVFHGDRDTTVAPANAAALIDHILPQGSPGAVPTSMTTGGRVPGGHAYTRTCYQDPAGAALAERWIIHQAGHAWSGGVPHGSHTDPRGPNASAEFIRFFGQYRAPGQPANPRTAPGRPGTPTADQPSS